MIGLVVIENKNDVPGLIAVPEHIFSSFERLLQNNCDITKLCYNY